MIEYNLLFVLYYKVYYRKSKIFFFISTFKFGVVLRIIAIRFYVKAKNLDLIKTAFAIEIFIKFFKRDTTTLEEH